MDEWWEHCNSCHETNVKISLEGWRSWLAENIGLGRLKFLMAILARYLKTSSFGFCVLILLNCWQRQMIPPPPETEHDVCALFFYVSCFFRMGAIYTFHDFLIFVVLQMFIFLPLYCLFSQSFTRVCYLCYSPLSFALHNFNMFCECQIHQAFFVHYVP